MSRPLKNLSNKIFNGITVIKFIKLSKLGAIWEFKCFCDKIFQCIGHRVSCGYIKSCGCKRGNIKERNQASLNVLFYKYKHSAKRRNKEFLLTKEQFKILVFEICHYCNAVPSSMQNLKYLNGDIIYNGIDRLDNTLGYTTTNSVTCCYKCNYSKHVETLDEFLKRIEKIYLKHFKKDK